MEPSKYEMKLGAGPKGKNGVLVFCFPTAGSKPEYAAFSLILCILSFRSGGSYKRRTYKFLNVPPLFKPKYYLLKVIPGFLAIYSESGASGVPGWLNPLSV